METRLIPAAELQVGDTVRLDWHLDPEHHQARITGVHPAPGVVHVLAICTEPGCDHTVSAPYGGSDLVELIDRPEPKTGGGW